MSAHEALASGVPVIASRTGALPEIVGPAGIIVEPRDAGAAGRCARRALVGRPGRRAGDARCPGARPQRAAPSLERCGRDTRMAYARRPGASGVDGA